MSYGIRKIAQYLIPDLSLIAIAAIVVWQLPEEKFLLIPYIKQLPLITLFIALLLSWKFSRTNTYYFLLLCLPIYTAIVYLLPNPMELKSYSTTIVIIAICVVLPANTIVIKTWKLANGLSFSNIKRLVFIAVQIAALFWLWNNELKNIDSFLNPELLTRFSLLPDIYPSISLITITLALLAQVFSIYRKTDVLAVHQLVALMSIFISLNFIENLQISILVYGSIGLLFSLAVIQESYEMAYVDPLTRLPGRRTMEEELEKLSGHYAIAMLDIDHFKKLNDNYGHDVGDQVLRMVAKHIRRVGAGGKACRYGGEEFSIIFPGKTAAHVMPFLEMLRNDIANTPFALRSKFRPKEMPTEREKKKAPSKLITVTVSIGASDSHTKNSDCMEILKTADKALYKAKKLGRNRTIYIKNAALP